MGRQRTINDAEFWRSPRIAGRTQEDKATLFYLLTSPDSNIIGIYQIVPRIAAAEMGWTADQLLPILKRLSSLELVRYDDASGFVWVRIWWGHNSAKMAVATTLREKTFAQIDAIPSSWKNEFLTDFLERIPFRDGNGKTNAANVELRNLVAREISNRGYGLSLPYPQPIDSTAANYTDNPNSNFNDYSNEAAFEFPAMEPSMREQLSKIILRLAPEMRQDVLDEIAAKLQAGTLRSPLRLAKHFADNPDKFVLADGHSIRVAREKCASVQAEVHKQARQRDSELENIIDEQLLYMNDVEFDATYGRYPPHALQQLRDRRSRLRTGSSA